MACPIDSSPLGALVVFASLDRAFYSAEETLVGKALSEDGTSKDVSLRSRVDPTSGGLCWLPVDAAVAAEGKKGDGVPKRMIC